MEPDLWSRVEQVFHRAAELDGAERARYLGEECADTPELRSRVEHLLEFDDPTTSYVDVSPLRGARTDRHGGMEGPSRTHDRLIGCSVGPYRLLEHVAEGGMGTIYRARRNDDLLDYVVAVKLIRHGMDNEQIVRRFQNECQTLAGLDHPHIGRLLDGGATEDGMPYLVMEFVEGEPLDVYGVSRRLTVRERLGLFRTVCETVHYAHQNLVVHRDLKPSNILVTSSGMPKLLDFGIAKVLDEGSIQPLDRTATAARLLTPDFASPEQIRGETVTTATDVYSLGVILYRLLTGRRPYRLTDARLDEIQRAVCEQDPTRPSTALLRADDRGDGSGSLASAHDTAALRRTGFDRLRRELRGDLDNIVMMALRKEPSRRYASAEQLAGDIGRHLDGLPVLAHKDTIAYRTSTFVRRHRLAVSLGALIFLALAAGLLATTRMANVAADERDAARTAEVRATAEAIHARIEADSAAEMATILARTLQIATAGGAEEQKTALDELKREIERVRRQYADHPHLQANLIDGIGRAHLALSRLDHAETLMKEAERLRRDEFGADSLEVARSLTSLGQLAFARGDYDTAADLHGMALTLHRELPEGVHTDVRQAARSLIAALRAAGREEETEALRKEILTR